jgi:hypothetical protein
MATENIRYTNEFQKTSQALLKLLSTAVENRMIIPRSLVRSGRHEEAIDAVEIVLDEVAASFGLQHPATLKVCLELAEIYRLAGRPDEAADWVRIAAEGARCTLRAS